MSYSSRPLSIPYAPVPYFYSHTHTHTLSAATFLINAQLNSCLYSFQDIHEECMSTPPMNSGH
jgi:hypothetical protein